MDSDGNLVGDDADVGVDRSVVGNFHSTRVNVLALHGCHARKIGISFC